MRRSAAGLAVVTILSGAASACEVSSFERQGVACPGRHYGPMIAAHRTLPCGTRIRATTRAGSGVFVVVDRGPFVRGRCLDVDEGAGARALGIVGPGHLPVTIEVVN